MSKRSWIAARPAWTSTAAPDTGPYDALLLVSFGGPEKPEDVIPFLENVTRGRGIPRERLVEVGEHYYAFGGRSPINDQNRAFMDALRVDLDEAGIDLPVYWGNRNWDPYLADALAQMAADGVTRAACFVTSAYSSWSGCRQYRENLYDAVEDVTGRGGPAARAARRARQVPRRAGRRQPLRLGVAGQPELRGGRLAEADRAGGPQPFHDVVGHGRHPPVVDR